MHGTLSQRVNLSGKGTSDIWTFGKGENAEENPGEDEDSEDPEDRPTVEVKPKKNNGTATVHSRDLRAIEHGSIVTIDITNKKKKRRLLLTKDCYKWRSRINI
ncbi:hypothetical protein [Oceanobacillus senegalensis]|uniref:hypothetical protein n=1 Tax=Oceanobacillus senegalensis TaxID=1936063 RepID=UPI000A312D69|nr:hypothetical protein [Oceanobacillus senegalensis]